LQVLYVDRTRKLSRTKHGFPTQEALKNQAWFSKPKPELDIILFLRARPGTGFWVTWGYIGRSEE
jgi:hypothetical protein